MIGSAAAAHAAAGASGRDMLSKAMFALPFAALLLAAERHGAAHDFVGELAISQKPLLERSRRQIPEMYPKAWRWDPEMDEVAAFLEHDDPAAAAVWRALARFYAARAAANEAGSELPLLEAILAPRA